MFWTRTPPHLLMWTPLFSCRPGASAQHRFSIGSQALYSAEVHRRGCYSKARRLGLRFRAQAQEAARCETFRCRMCWPCRGTGSMQRLVRKQETDFVCLGAGRCPPPVVCCVWAACEELRCVQRSSACRRAGLLPSCSCEGMGMGG